MSQKISLALCCPLFLAVVGLFLADIRFARADCDPESFCPSGPQCGWNVSPSSVTARSESTFFDTADVADPVFAWCSPEKVWFTMVDWNETASNDITDTTITPTFEYIDPSLHCGSVSVNVTGHLEEVDEDGILKIEGHAIAGSETSCVDVQKSIDIIANP